MKSIEPGVSGYAATQQKNPAPNSQEARTAIFNKLVLPAVKNGGNVNKAMNDASKASVMAGNVFKNHDKNKNNLIEPEEIPDKDPDLYQKFFNHEVDENGKPIPTKPIPTNFVDATENYYKKHSTEQK